MKNLQFKKLIVALDADSKKEIEKIVKVLSPYKVKFKIGPIAFVKFGQELLRKFVRKKIDIFLDLKLHDIPNTMKETAKVITQMGVWAFTVHTKAGSDALCAVKKEVSKTARREKIRKPLILGVTELTSSAASVESVVNLSKQAKKAGIDGVIASAKEATAIKKACGESLLVVSPGIRNPGGKAGDQKRITTAQAAFKAGADFIVVGRPIIDEKNHLKAAEGILSN